MQDNNNSKKRFTFRYIFVLLIILVILFAGYLRLVVFSDGFGMPMNYQMAYFGKSYFELYSFQNEKEKEIGNEIVERVKFCMEYTGDEDSAPQTDELSRYYYFPCYDKPAKTEVDISLKKAVLNGDKGSVWFVYTLHRFNENGDSLGCANNILTKCKIEKDKSGEWIVTNVSEPP
jgi:hypothetical protein